MATPISAASAGASFTPSPTIITGPFLRSLSTRSTYWSGVSSARTASRPRPSVTARATARRSTVASRIRPMPWRRTPARKSAVPERNASARTRCPASWPSTATATSTEPGSGPRTEFLDAPIPRITKSETRSTVSRTQQPCPLGREHGAALMEGQGLAAVAIEIADIDRCQTATGNRPRRYSRHAAPSRRKIS